MYELITEGIYDVGVNDHSIDLFESQYVVPNGVAYNSYVILDEKIVIMDTVDKRAAEEWLFNLSQVLGDKTPDYLVIQHLEPDHSHEINELLRLYPNLTVILSKKAHSMLPNFLDEVPANIKTVDDGESFSIGKRELVFFTAPMVHWPEVIMTYDKTDKILFSADAFGKFGTKDLDEVWDNEARRYYYNIVGKYGAQVQNLFKKLGPLAIETICPLHGPILKSDLGHYLEKYQLWSTYTPEIEGVFIPVASIHGNSNHVAEIFAGLLMENGCPNVKIMDLTRQDVHEAVSNCFNYSKIVFVASSYDAGVFAPMDRLCHILAHKNYQNHTIGFIQNGSWAPSAAKTMKAILEPCKDLEIKEPTVTITTRFKESNLPALKELADAIWPKVNA